MIQGRDQWTADKEHRSDGGESGSKRQEAPETNPDKILNATLEFCDYNNGNAARTGMIQLSGPTY